VTAPLVGRAVSVAGTAALAGFLAGLLLGRTEADPWTTAIAAAAASLVGAVTGFVVFWGPARAMAAVAEAARGIRDGRLGARVEDPSRGAAVLVRSFNQMAERLEELVEAGRAEEARLRAAFEASADGMVAASADGTIQLLNRSAAQLLGVEPEAAIGRRFIEAVRDYELAELIRAAAAEGRPQLRVIAYGPQRVPVRAEARPIAGGGAWAVLLVLTDLSEVQRTEQIRRDFISNVSHELRTPLASIRAIAESLELEAGEESPAGAAARDIVRQVGRLTAMVNELLDLSRIESGALQLDLRAVNLREAAAEAVATVAPRLAARRVQVDVEVPAALEVVADRATVVRVLVNLLDNAAKYAPEESSIRVSAVDEGESVRLAVEDEGPGIAPEHLPRIFERFYKGDPSRASEGVGLGLAIVKHLVRAHGGRVWAENREEGGARFVIRLPKEPVAGRDPAR